MVNNSSLSIKEWYNRIYWNQESQSSFRPYKTYKIFLDYLEVRTGSALLDVGAGDGRLLRAACESDMIAFGVDFSEAALIKAASFAPNAYVAVGEGERLPFPDASFQYLTCLGSLEHFNDIESGLVEMVRVCKNGARLCIMVPNSFYLFDIISVFKKGYSRNGTFQPQEKLATHREWRDLLESRGLRVLTVHRDKEPIDTSWGNVFSDLNPLGTINRFIEKILQIVMPLNLGYQFVFTCEKHNKTSLHATS